MLIEKVVIITGASSGIGKATALEFAERKWNLSLNGRNEEELKKVAEDCKLLGASSVITTVGDLREHLIRKTLVIKTIETFSQIDCLVNCAGILVAGNVETCDIPEYDKVFDVNVRSVIIITQLVIPFVIETKGTIVNVSSVAGTNVFPGVLYYCMSKAALDQFTKCLALELAPNGVRVNSVNPGVIISNIQKRAGLDEESYKVFIEQSNKAHALGRVGLGHEVAKAIYFLATEASSFTSGHLLMVDGGRAIMTAH